ncbi:FtsX-like permease family protein [Listeria monocytogenes]|uniref:FtsX-like permease family protein n=1 Tax=Listeria innocua TaxID=1642 RepID=UPI0010E7B4F4|nr:ABC transporter permease [Listeria innocua]EAD8348884.1 ABC transporter permease [Listeria monocytogenes]EAD8393806.1 ABC transporter permease [Listeria monocytogenes]EAE6687557.1 ABC transporter permease [Listeria monocytogenes]ECZ8707646.1 ABC transporter permease [Listeria monocytogenes]EHE1137547.1 ABC transporter permease [Listeria monocytogenes]
MLNKLMLRNAKRSVKNYTIYIVTMTIISALMFAFNSMIFSEDMKTVYHKIGIFIALVSVASFFIFFIIIWLVRYMVNFMMERRSQEFGTYLLIGMKKKQIAQLFLRENILLGLLSFALGIIPGFLFQKLFTNIFYVILNEDYPISGAFSLVGILVTAGILLLSYLFALINIQRKFKKMAIKDFFSIERSNDEITVEQKSWKKFFVPLSILYIIIFHVLMFTGKMTILSTWFYIFGLFLSIYLLYVGLSPFFVNYLQSRRKGVYRGANLFILRQLSSKIKTMRFTLGTLTLLFAAALLSSTIVTMFADYQNQQMNKQLPFDTLIFSDQKDADFNEFLPILKTNTELDNYIIYRIYENNTNVVNDFMYQHRKGTYLTDVHKNGKSGDNTYFGQDTYIKLSDYNRLRELINLKPVSLKQGQYILHGKASVENDLKKITKEVQIKIDKKTLSCQEIRTEPFSQEGMNGADYLLVVNDTAATQMKPYYSLLAANLNDNIPIDLQDQLKAKQHYFDQETSEDLYDIEVGRGSSQVLSWADTVIVADNVIRDSKFVITAVCFVLAYLAIIFLCTAFTILAVQQLSDSEKYRFRYKILKQLGLNKLAVRKVILKQLLAYYLCPLLISILLSMVTGLFLSERFVYFTGIAASSFQYYILGVLLFIMIYIAYFTTTYISFIRNVEK